MRFTKKQLQAAQQKAVSRYAMTRRSFGFIKTLCLCGTFWCAGIIWQHYYDIWSTVATFVQRFSN